MQDIGDIYDGFPHYQMKFNLNPMLADLEIKSKIHAVFVYRGSEESCEAFLIEQDNVLEEISLQMEELESTDSEGD